MWATAPGSDDHDRSPVVLSQRRIVDLCIRWYCLRSAHVGRCRRRRCRSARPASPPVCDHSRKYFRAQLTCRYHCSRDGNRSAGKRPATRENRGPKPNFRARLGEFLGSECQNAQTGPASAYCVRVTPRVNIASDAAPKLILRDSAQVATRVRQPSCGPDFANSLGLSETRDHCGAMSIWDVASGGRMGMVTGEDSTEVANPPSDCITDCRADNSVGGRLEILGFPSPVPATSRLTARTSTDGLSAPLTAP
jgi:hypothetical protein